MYCVGLVTSIRQPNHKVLKLQKDYEAEKAVKGSDSEESNEVDMSE
jgi:hypothetical protein